MKAVETKYKGYRFRSRLEARWAIFFDALGCRWEYELQGYDLGRSGWYLCDFFLRSPDGLSGVWCEVKATRPTRSEILKLKDLVKHTGTPGWFLVGSPGEDSALVCIGPQMNVLPPVVGDDADRWRSQIQLLLTQIRHNELIEPPALLDSLEFAVGRARGARFEHGEQAA